MKKLIFLKLALCTFLFAACEKETFDDLFKIDGITMENYPKVDGSTTTIGLQNLIACKLLGFKYDWFDGTYFLDGAYAIYPVQDPPGRYWECVKSSKTHDSFINLIDKNVDFTLTARKMSNSEKAYADAAGVTLIETPVALDAFIFITNNENPVNALTTKQIQDIYTGKVTNWREVDGKNAAIHPYRRNEDSGSQELMESLVMQDLEMMDLPNENNLFSMLGTYHALEYDVDGLCYTVYYYMDRMQEQIEANYNQIKEDVKMIVVAELKRISEDENLKHLIKKE
jgi:phosphate transport system substrate-binding protein